MSSFQSCWRFSVLLSIFWGFSLIVIAPKATAGGVVTSADQASLQNALNGGGTVTFGVDGTITLTSTITIAQDTVLDASGRSVTIDGGGAVRLFYVNSAVNFTIINLGLANGKYLGTNGVSGSANGEPAYGGGIYNNTGTLTILGCNFGTNIASGGSGYTSAIVFGNGGSAYGGAIYNNQGTVNVTNSFFINNQALAGSGTVSTAGDSFGGAIYSYHGVINADQATFQRNQATGGMDISNGLSGGRGGNGSGGAVFSDSGSLIVRHSFVVSNAVTGMWGQKASAGGIGKGGAFFNSSGQMTVSDTLFSTNSATGGQGAPTYGIGGLGAGGAIYNTGALSLQRDSFLGNSSTGDGGNDGSGGAVFSATDFDSNACLFTGNLATGGQDTITIRGSTYSGHGYGGGIYSAAGLSLWNCTFSENQAIGGKYGYTATAFHAGNGNGGGLYNLGTLFATNCTVSANSATGGAALTSGQTGGDGNGGGILNAGGTITLTFVTFSGNNAIRGAGTTPGNRTGGGILNTNGTANIRNSIIANSQFGGNAFGPLTDDGNNISSDGTCSFTAPGSLNNTDPLLGPLVNNGGSTPTMALLAGSPALNAANPAYLAATDQRGISRPQGAASDIGAFEVEAARQPVIYSFSPTNGLPGTTVLIAGTNFLLTTQVSFNGTNASFSVNSDAQISATAPSGFTTGPITVTTPDGIAVSSNNFGMAGPVPTTGAATANSGGATLNGTVMRDGSGGDSAYFQYGTSTNYGINTALQTFGSGSGLFPIYAIINGLTPQTSYHFRVVAKNSSVTNYGADQIFTTTTPTISVNTTAASAITNDSAVLNGQGNAGGYAATVYFQYGPTTNLGAATAGQSIGNGTDPVPFSTTVSGLIAGHAYYFRAGITNGYSTNYGAILSFASALSRGADYALSFDGVNDFVQVPHNAGLNAYPLTITAWFRTTQSDGYVGIAGKLTNSPQNGYEVSITDGRLHAFYFGTGASVFKSTNGLDGGVVSDGLWHQASFTVDGSGGKLYLDGTLTDSVAWTGTPNACTTTAPLKFGPYLDYLNGQLDEIALWNVALTGTQIQTGLTNRLTGIESNLIGYWRMEEGNGLTAGDSSGHGNDGTLVNGPVWVYSGTPLPKRIAAAGNRQSNGSVRFVLTGAPGQNFTLQSSISLTNWTNVLTGVIGADGTFQYVDTNSVVTPNRFLRSSQ